MDNTTAHTSLSDDNISSIARRIEGPHDCDTIIRSDAPRLLAEVWRLREAQKRTIAEHASVGDLAPVFTLVNERFQGSFYAGEPLASVLLRLLHELIESKQNVRENVIRPADVKARQVVILNFQSDAPNEEAFAALREMLLSEFKGGA